MDFPIFLNTPKRLTLDSAWREHIPFGMYLVSALKPEVIVELGTHGGDSYCCFCQAVEELKLNTRCFAVDTWKGDPQSGYYGREVLETLHAYHDPLYGSFSTLIQTTFDDAVSHFADGEVTLLHIDGYHTYDAVKHDFESWLPKLSRNGVVLFHDTNVREKDFGVWRLWGELTSRYPSFEFLHGHGLGVLGVGKNQTKELCDLFGSSDEKIANTRRLFSSLGHNLTVQIQVQRLSSELDRSRQEIQSFSSELDKSRQEIQSFSSELDKSRQEIQSLSLEVALKEEGIRTYSAQIQEIRSSLAQIHNSNGWKALQRYYRIRDQILPKGGKWRSAITFLWRVATRQPVSLPKRRWRDL